MRDRVGIRGLVAGAIAVTAVIGVAGCTGDGAATRISTVSTASATPTASTAPPLTSTPGAMPKSCDDLFTPALKEYISPDGFLALNPAWLQEPGNERKLENGYGTFDPELAKMLSVDTGVLCDWSKASGPGEVFLITQVRKVDAATQQTALARMAELASDPNTGWTCVDYTAGRWCLVNTNDGTGNVQGESHFFRDGIWIASDWVNAGPEEYTPHLVQRIFG